MENLGKKKCEVLKMVRKAVADAHGIKYEPAVCTHQGDCKGTCPKCEAEVQYIESEIKKKYGDMSKKVAVSVGTVVTSMTLASCWGNGGMFEAVGIEPAPGHDVEGEPIECPNKPDSANVTPDDSIFELEGDVACPMEEPEIEEGKKKSE